MLILVTITSHAWAEGLPNILGIQLGMPVREAYAKLQAELPKYKPVVQSVNLPTIEKPVIAWLWSAPQDAVAMGVETDQVRVDVTLPPNKQAVWKVDRTHFFPDKGIVKTTLLTSLREKYGKETMSNVQRGKPAKDDNEVVELLWLFDEQGRPAVPPTNVPGSVSLLLSGCTGLAVSDSRGFVENGRSQHMSSQMEWCYSSYTGVYAMVSQSSFAPELYGSMKMVMASFPFAVQAGEVTKKWKEDIAEGAHKRDLENAKQQEKPKL
jgi:hypothetical protein